MPTRKQRETAQSYIKRLGQIGLRSQADLPIMSKKPAPDRDFVGRINKIKQQVNYEIGVRSKI